MSDGRVERKEEVAREGGYGGMRGRNEKVDGEGGMRGKVDRSRGWNERVC